MGKLILPSELLEKLRCTICSKYLSIFPIYVKCEGDNDAICGRCKVPSEDDFLRDEGYENLARFIMFPCAMEKNGCTEELQPQKLKKHEQLCVHNKLDCPSKTYTRCQWQGSTAELLKHYEQTHTGLLLKTREFELCFLNSFKDSMIIPYNEELFIVKKELDSRSGIFWCTVEHLKQSTTNKNYNYQLKLYNGNKSSSYKFSSKSTDMDSDNLTTKVSSDFIKDKLNDPATIVGVIELFIPNTQEITQDEEQSVTQQEHKDPSVDWELLSELECPVCLEFVLPPIHQCNKGHSICSGCKPRLDKCPLCQNAISNTQNFMLEKITSKLKYPCKFYKNGCPKVLLSSEIKKHESLCLHGPYDCPLKDKEHCTIKCNKTELAGHIDNAHQKYILMSDRINLVFDENESYEEYYLIKFASRIFKGCFKYENKKFFWTVQLVGTREDCKSYKFEVDVTDNSGKRLRRYIKGLCVPLSAQDTIFVNANTYEYVSLDQVAPLITDTLSYHIRVVKD